MCHNFDSEYLSGLAMTNIMQKSSTYGKKGVQAIMVANLGRDVLLNYFGHLTWVEKKQLAGQVPAKQCFWARSRTDI
jgi:hypothetical protein